SSPTSALALRNTVHPRVHRVVYRQLEFRNRGATVQPRSISEELSNSGSRCAPEGLRALRTCAPSDSFVILTISLIAGILLVCRPLKGTERDSMRSFVPTAGSVERQWHVIDAEGQVLGRVATEAARLLQGKHKAVYTPHIDTGDHVVIVNAAKVRLTGRK